MKLRTPEFANDPKESFRQWLRRFQATAAGNLWNPAQTMVAAQYALTGQAADMAETLSFAPAGYAGANDGERLLNFYAALRNLFLDPARQSVARATFEVTVQKRGENLRVFHAVLLALWIDAWLGQDEPWREQQPVIPQLPYDDANQAPGSRSQRLIEKFIQGIRDKETRLKVRDYITMGHNIIEYQDVLTIALSFESNKDRNEVEQRRIAYGVRIPDPDAALHRPRPRPAADAPVPMEIGNLDLGAMQGQGRKWCRFHQTDTHADAECQAQKNQRQGAGPEGAAKGAVPRGRPPVPAGQPRPRPGPRVDRAAAKCGNCGGVGHFRKECPSAKKELPPRPAPFGRPGGNPRPVHALDESEQGDDQQDWVDECDGVDGWDEVSDEVYAVEEEEDEDQGN